MEYFLNFYQRKNFGDDLFVYLITNKFPNYKFHISGPKQYIKQFEKQSNIIVHYDKVLVKKINGAIRRIFKKNILQEYRTRKCDGAIYVGGSIYIEPSNMKLTDYYDSKSNMYIKNKPFYVIGANFGPYKQENFYRHFQEEFKKYDWISFREKASYELFSDIENVKYFPDMIFSIRNSYKVKKKFDNKTDYIIFSVMGKAAMKEYDLYIKQIAKYIKAYIEKGFKVVLMGMCQWQGDFNAAETINKLVNNKAEIVNYDENIDDILEIIANAKYMIGSRFHAIVTALAFDVKVYPIYYSDKTLNMLKDIGYKGDYKFIDNIAELSFDDLNKNYYKKNYVNAIELAREAEGHYMAITLTQN